MYNNIWQSVALGDKDLYRGSLIRKLNELFTKTPSNEPDCTQVLNNVWLGNFVTAGDALFVLNKNISMIVNVTLEIPNKLHKVRYTNLPVKEKSNCADNFGRILNIGADVIHQETSLCNNVLVHCKRGHHRSASVIAFYLMKYHGMSVVDAITYVKSYRPNSFRRFTCMVDYMIDYDVARYYSFKHI